MGPELQSKFLRVLEEREFYPVGGERPRSTKARIIAATHRPLEELVRDGSFREDLYFRLKVVEIQVPPLRERKGDVLLLAKHLLSKIGRKLHRELKGVSDEAMEVLESYEWPGNVRELENTLTRAAVLARGPIIGADQISLAAIPTRRRDEGAEGPRDDSLEAVEAAHVQRILNETGGNKRRTARILGISRPRLDRLIEKHHTDLPR
jgi:DNA-binding NtrC family response regulator